MDALAQGYGSDSSNSSSSSPSPFKEEEKVMTNNSSAFNLLASNYSDDSDADVDADADDGAKAMNVVNDDSPTSNECDNRNQLHRPQKRPRQNDDKSENTCLRYQLPPPRLLLSNDNNNNNNNNSGSSSSIISHHDNPFEALVLFSKDYVTKTTVEAQTQTQNNQEQKQASTNNDDVFLATKLNNLYHKFYTTNDDDDDDDDKNKRNGQSSSMQVTSSSLSSSFAKHLKHQKEFGNPHLFPSIITHFGIDPFGSNCLDNNTTTNSAGINTDNKNDKEKLSSKSSFGRFEYMERIVQKEEENRIRNASIR